MHSASRLLAAVLCCALLACASVGIGWHEGLWRFDVQDEQATAPPAIHPYLVEAFWLDQTPDYPFDVVGRFAFTTFYFADNVRVQVRVRNLAGKRGANVVVFQSEEVVESSCDDPDCMGDYRVLRGVLGRRRV